MDQDLITALSDLVTDPAFLEFRDLESAPNLFKTVGHSHTERWHTAFLGWLMDPKGSHGLGYFPLRRFLVATAKAAAAPTATEEGFPGPRQLAYLAATLEFEHAEALVMPNERNRAEKGFGKDSRFDVWVDMAVPQQDENDKRKTVRFILLVESKVNSSLAEGQADRYADYMRAEVSAVHIDDVLEAGLSLPTYIAMVYLGRTEAEPQVTVGNPLWYCMDYQALHDLVLVPCQMVRGLDPGMERLIHDYIRTLMHENKKGRLAVTDNEMQLAMEIARKHARTLLRLAEVLNSANMKETVDEDTADSAAQVAEHLKPPSKQPEPLLAQLVDGTVVTGKSVPDFYRNVFGTIVKHGCLAQLSLPFAAGHSRYLISDIPTHPEGNDFFSPLEVESEDHKKLYMETNDSRDRANRLARKLLASVGLI